MNWWLAMETVVTVALVALLVFRRRIGPGFSRLSMALSIALMLLCIGEWISAGSGTWTVVTAAVAIVGFAVALVRDRGARIDTAA